MKEKYQHKYRVQSTSLKMWNYAQNGYYFVTICTDDNEHYLGRVVNSEISLSKIGEIAQSFWKQIPEHYPFVTLDAVTIMPNHIQGIIIIDKSDSTVETQNFASLQHNDYRGNKFGPQSENLGAIIRGYKVAVKKYATMNNINFTWQPRYYDHIIRNEEDLNRIRTYIVNNPMDEKSLSSSP